MSEKVFIRLRKDFGTNGETLPIFKQFFNACGFANESSTHLQNASSGGTSAGYRADVKTTNCTSAFLYVHLHRHKEYRSVTEKDSCLSLSPSLSLDGLREGEGVSPKSDQTVPKFSFSPKMFSETYVSVMFSFNLEGL